MSTRLVVPFALPSTRLKVNVPSSVTSRESMNISMMPVDWLKFIVYFWAEKERRSVSSGHDRQDAAGVTSNCYLSLRQDDVIEDVVHLAGRGAFLHLGPESHAAFLQQLHGHLILEGNNWRRTHFFFFLQAFLAVNTIWVIQLFPNQRLGFSGLQE